MDREEGIARWRGRESALPPTAEKFSLREIADTEVVPTPLIDDDDDLQSISAFVCIIEYDGEQRLISCRRYDVIGDQSYVGAICHSAGGYRQFRCDRVSVVFDASTGEELGDGSYFDRFEVTSRRERAATWGLTPSRKATVVAGLNVLAFMARCDGHWHRLENDPIERFVCSMWLRKEWPGEPPLAEILAHAQRLSPDAETFFKALRHYAGSSTSTMILRRAISDLIDADGVLRAQEISWGAEVDAFFRESADAEVIPDEALLIRLSAPPT